MQFKTMVSWSVLTAATLSLTVACGSPNDKKAPVKNQQQKEENIQAGLTKLTGGKFNPGAAENMKMAAQLEAASATVTKLPGKDEKQIVWGVRVRFLLKGLPEIAAQKELGQSQDLEALQNDAGVPSKYLIEAVCGGTNCDRVTAILSEKAAAGSGVEASRIAVIFKREKSFSEMKQLAEKKRQEKANGKSKDDGKDKSVSLEFDETKPMALKVFWSSSGSAGGMSGGVKKTIEDLEGTELLKAHQAAKWPAEHEDGNKVLEPAIETGTGTTGTGAGEGTEGALPDVELNREAGAAQGNGAGAGSGADTEDTRGGGSGTEQPPAASSPIPGSAPLGQGGTGHSF